MFPESKKMAVTTEAAAEPQDQLELQLLPKTTLGHGNLLDAPKYH